MDHLFNIFSHIRNLHSKHEPVAESLPVDEERPISEEDFLQFMQELAELSTGFSCIIDRSRMYFRNLIADGSFSFTHRSPLSDVEDVLFFETSLNKEVKSYISERNLPLRITFKVEKVDRTNPPYLHYFVEVSIVTDDSSDDENGLPWL